MQKKLTSILIFGFAQLFLLVILSNHVVDGTISILGTSAFKLGNKTVTIEDIEGFDFSTDSHYNRVFSQPDAAFFIIKELENDMVEMILTGTQIRSGAYQNFDDIKSDYTNDSNLIILSVEESNSFLDVKFINKESDSRILFVRFYEAYPYFLQLLTTWEGNPDEIPLDIEKALSAIRVTQ